MGRLLGGLPVDVNWSGFDGVVEPHYGAPGGPYFHTTLAWRFRLVDDESMDDPWKWQLTYYQKPTIWWPDDDMPAPGHFLVRGLPEQGRTLLLLLPVTGLLFLIRMRFARTWRTQA